MHQITCIGTELLSHNYVEMDPVHNLYMRLRAIEGKVAQCDIEATVAPEEVKAAYYVIKAHHISMLTAIKTEIATAISAALNMSK